MNRHAYLIIAHNDFGILEKTLRILDDERNDFFIHIDKKVKDFDFDYFNKILLYSKIKFINRRSIGWGADSLIYTELKLFTEASKDDSYSYYHLISGVDLPIKNKNIIYDFFEKNEKSEYIESATEEKLGKLNREYRFSMYHIFNNLGVNKKYIRTINKYFLELQKKIKVDRYRGKFKYGFGSEWASLSNDGVRILVENREWAQKVFKYTHGCDEIYKQSILKNFGENIIKIKNYNARYIIWPIEDNAKHPKTLGIEDLDDINLSECLFARKFSTSYDNDIIEKIYKANK